MPISKRDKKVDSTKVRKKPTNKSDVISKIKKLVDNYENVFILQFENIRNERLNQIRQELANSDSKLVFAKNSLISLAFGKDKTDSYKPGLYKLSSHLKGSNALLFSNSNIESLRDSLNAFRNSEYSRPGQMCSQTVIISAGPMPKFIHTDEVSLRKLGLPTKLVRGVVTVEKDYRVCTKGNQLNPEQCRLLKHFQVQQSEFRVSIVAQWCSKNNKTSFIKEKDAYNVITSLEPCVKITCDKLDDGLFYFIPTPIADSVYAEEKSMDYN